MAALGQIIKTIVTLATLLASFKTIISLARFAWNLVLQLFKKGSYVMAGAKGAAKVGKFAWSAVSFGR